MAQERMDIEAECVEPGEIVAGRFVIERRIGEGGMGLVFMARQERLARRVAIKFLAEEALASADARMRFEREARAAAALHSEHVVRVIDVGHHTNRRPYIVMELLSGEDLASRLQRLGPLPIDDAIAHVTAACDALAEAHALGIVHRDLKPANLFLAERANGETVLKVLDFGVSKAEAGATGSTTLTTASMILGSPAYMSPEQLREAHAVDGRADIWALGLTLYELLTGRRPFVAPTIPELHALILTADPWPPRSLRPEVSAALESLVLRCLEKEPADRFATARELGAALADVGRAQAAAHPSGTFSSAVALKPSPWSRKGRALRALLQVAAVAAVAMGVAFALGGRRVPTLLPVDGSEPGPRRDPVETQAERALHRPEIFESAPQPTVRSAATAAQAAKPTQRQVKQGRRDQPAAAPSPSGNPLDLELQ